MVRNMNKSFDNSHRSPSVQSACSNVSNNHSNSSTPISQQLQHQNETSDSEADYDDVYQESNDVYRPLKTQKLSAEAL